MIESLDGKAVVVTGAASGLGLAMAERFTAEGMRVVLADIEADALEAARAKLAGGGGEVLARRTDVSVAEEVEALAEFAFDRLGAVHVVCNNAGVAMTGRSWELSLDDWRWIVNVNLWGVIYGIKAFVPRMIASGEVGHVVNTSSSAGLLPFTGIAPYATSKAGIVALSEILCRELRERPDPAAPIGVSVLFPVQTPTNIYSSGRNRQADYGAPPPPMEWSTTVLTSPEDAAAAVVDAIRTDRFWVITHDQFLKTITERAQGIIDGFTVVVPPSA